MSKGHDIIHNRGNASMYFIDIIEVIEDGYRKEREHRRTSSLGVSKNHPGALSVLGNLPHNYMWKPKTSADRKKLVDFLNSLEYTE